MSWNKPDFGRRKFSDRQRVRLLKRAVRENWPITLEQWTREMEWVGQLVGNPNTSDSIALEAGELVRLIDERNAQLNTLPLPASVAPPDRVPSAAK